VFLEENDESSDESSDDSSDENTGNENNGGPPSFNPIKEDKCRLIGSSAWSTALSVKDSLSRLNPVPEQQLPPEVSVGDIIRTPDRSAVYFVDEDNRRHVFPTLTVYASWYGEDFTNVKIIPTEIMAEIALGSNVTIRSGTHLIKVETDRSVYAVEEFGVIRLIRCEEDAIDLFGDNWAKRVRDISPVFFPDYVLGDPLPSGYHPSGSVITYEGSVTRYYIDGSRTHQITGSVFADNLFQDEFVVPEVPVTFIYEPGDDMTKIPEYILFALP